ncbi:hypothetical protein ACCC92_26260 [Mucilaginibacter sp. Mucisp84]|uniref:hypothetical protein n=1 Tax=Mucilaginibacter sp. Mucisp84 TaxID=3243058 RepID=UPI0039A4F148
MINQNNNAGITDDDIKKAEAYKNALDALKTSIIGVNSKLPEFADGIKDGLKALGEKLPEVVDAMQKLNEQNKELAASGQKPKNILKELASSMLSWNSLISVGITLLANYSGVIIDWVSALFKGGDAIDELKIKQQAMGEAFKGSGYKKAISDVMELTAKIKLAKNGYAEKKEVLAKYNETLGETLGKTNNLDFAERNIVKHGKDYIQMMYYRAAATALLNNNTDQIIESQKEIQAAEEKSIESHNALSNFEKVEADRKEKYGAASTARAKIFLTIQQQNADKELAIAKNKSKNLSEATASLYQQLDKQAESYAEKFEVPDNALKTIDDIENRISRLSKKIEKNKSDANTSNRLVNLGHKLKELKDFASDDKFITIKAIKQRVAELLKMPDAKTNGSETSNRLARLNQRLAQLKKTSDAIGSSHVDHKQNIAHEKRGADLLQAKAIDFAKQIELDKQSYDIELVALNDVFSKKLISQEDYNKKSEELQQKFHLGIGDKIQFFNKNDFNEAKKQMQAMIDAQQHEDTMAKDQKKVDKALLPGQKLDVEKQLINDKYAYEIWLATGNAEKIKALEDQKQKDITALTQQYEQQRKEFALQSAQQVSDKAFSIIQNNIKNQSDAKIRGLENDKTAELSNKNLTNTQKKAIEDKYQKKEAAEKVKAFKAEQKASILQAVINGALAITKATSQTGILAPFVIPGIIASTAIQVATIVGQKPPQYAKGGLHYQSDGRGALLPGYSRTDNTNAYLRSGEAVVVSEAMRNPWARNLVSAINVAHGGRDFSIPNPGRGYAIGGIFTDGGNTNRYYNQPVNDVKDLANTLAYQMINNFPPVYVDVKDINNQQNILAQTINRVNL